MSEENTEQSANKRKCKRRGRGFIIIVALVSALVGGLVTKAVGHMKHRWHHNFVHGKIDPAKAERRAEYIANRLAKKVDATSEQKQKLVVIAKSLTKDLLPLREKMRDTRAEARKLLTQEQIDKSAIETFRAEKIALADQISKRVSVAMAEAADVLTVEQRQKISDRWLHKRHHWR